MAESVTLDSEHKALLARLETGVHIGEVPERCKSCDAPVRVLPGERQATTRKWSTKAEPLDPVARFHLGNGARSNAELDGGLLRAEA